MNEYIKSMYCGHDYNFDYEPSIDPEPYIDREEESDKKHAKKHLQDVLYWLYEAENFDERKFESSLEDLCSFLNTEFPNDLLKRKVE